MNLASELIWALSFVPAGRWGVAVSGGADSVALLRLVCERPELQPHVIHLDHETRNGASAADANFVETLATQLGVPVSVARRSAIHIPTQQSPALPPRVPPSRQAEPRSKHAEELAAEPLGSVGGSVERGNRSAIYRAARLAWFSIVVQKFDLAGVLLAHHADDQAETVAQRLLRSRRPGGLGGMACDVRINGVRLMRPLLGIPGDALRQYLNHLGQLWVEDASNASADFQRNRLRQCLSNNPDVRDALLRLGAACGRLGVWLENEVPVLRESFDVRKLSSLPQPLARQSASRWLRDRGAPPADLSPAVCDRLVTMATDLASAARIDFPGAIAVLRSRGHVTVLPGRAKRPQQFGRSGVLKGVQSV